jgi:hypothetical protein
MLIRGGCHCGNLSFTLAWDPDPVEIPARACDCTFCTRHGGVWTSKPDCTLAVTVREPSQISRYAFGTRTAHFHICSRCGVVPVVTSRIGERLYAVVNVNTFENVDALLLRRAPAHFDGEDEAARLARRTRNWIGDVRFGDAERTA